MIRRRKKKLGKADAVPMSAMIDVVFLLLVFFIVTHKDELIEAHVSVAVPSAGPGTPQQVQLTKIHVPSDNDLKGQYLFMGSTPMDIDTIEETLAGLAVLDSDQQIIIKVSPEATQSKLVSLLDRCKKLQLNKLNVLTLKE